jgi:hypothetical protein
VIWRASLLLFSAVTAVVFAACAEPFPLPGKSQLAKPTPFGGGAIESPLSGQSPFRSAPSARKPFQEPSGLSPDMEISPISDVPWWRSITLTQVVSACFDRSYIHLLISSPSCLQLGPHWSFASICCTAGHCSQLSAVYQPDDCNILGGVEAGRH